jgi:hypothetical protein
MITTRAAVLLACLAGSGAALAQDAAKSNASPRAAVAAADSCDPSDITRDWLLTFQPGKSPQACVFGVAKNGSVTGFCSSNEEKQASLGGKLEVSELCQVTGDLVVDDEVTRQRYETFIFMSADRTVLHGVVERGGKFLPATAIRFAAESLK